MQKKENRFVLKSLEISEIEQKGSNQIRKNIENSFQKIMEFSNIPFFVVFLSLLVNVLFMLNIILSLDSGDQWSFNFITNAKSIFGYSGLKLFENDNLNVLRLIIYIVLILYSTFAILFITVLSQYCSQGIKLKVLKLISLWYSVINPAFGVFFYSFFGQKIACPEFQYNSKCLSGFNLVFFFCSIIGIFEILIMNFIGMVYFHVTNPVIPSLQTGGSKELLLIYEIERIVFAMYFVIKQSSGSDKQFIIFMTILAGFKIYKRINESPFINFRYNSLHVFFNSFLEIFIAQVCFVVFSESNPGNPISFVLAFLICILFGISFQHFLEFKFFRINEIKLESTEKFEEELMEYSRVFIATIVNLDNGIEYRKKMENLLFIHRLECVNVSCECNQLKKYDFKYDKAEILAKECSRFWNKKLKEFFQTLSSNSQLLLQSMFISLYHTDEIISVLVNFKKLEIVKKDMSQRYEVTIIKFTN